MLSGGTGVPPVPPDSINRTVYENRVMRATSLQRGRLPRRGSITVWLVVSLGVILAVAALSLDGGRLMDERRRVQAAAGAAALAAAPDPFDSFQHNPRPAPTG